MISVIINARRSYFSELKNSNNSNNPRVLFSNVDSLINPAPNYYPDHLSISKCNAFSAYFRDKIAAIRMNIIQKRLDNVP